MIIKLLIDGGDMKPGPAVAQQLGPIGVNIGKVISQANDVTKEFKGMKVPIEIEVNEKTKNFIIYTSSPPTSELLKKELSLEKGSNKISSLKVGNSSIEDVIKIAKIKLPNMLEKDLKKAVKSVLGTCTSIGIFVENKNSKDVIKEVEDGKYDEEINQRITETDIEKRQLLNEFFLQYKKEQEAKAAAAAKVEEVAAETKEAEAGKTTDVGKAAAVSAKTPTPAKQEVKQVKKTEKVAGKKEKKK